MTGNVDSVDKNKRIVLGVTFILGGLLAPISTGLKVVSFVLAGNCIVYRDRWSLTAL
ncbi:MAG: hypothetical protein JSV13_01725 [Nitrospiraceae bacterium]|jgi:hypothetical protein|nr:MAG: hypothetical protein JSV13_01725 [Nitrospiraceae bacterium]